MTVKDSSRADKGDEGDLMGTCNSNFPIVGIGASAGGLKALETFFAHLPMDGDMKMAFVLVQHLHPAHKSLLCDLLERYTELKVCGAKDGLEVLPRTIYTAPPGQDVTIRQGKLCLHPFSPTRGVRLPIDTFFRSLAEDRKEQAVCIVLSGSGTDGTLGLKAVKGEGGMAMVQDPGSAEHQGMPLSAVATGMADYVLPPEEMPLQLMSYVRHLIRKGLTNEIPLPTTAVKTLQDILALIHSQTGHNFSGYKENPPDREAHESQSDRKLRGLLSLPQANPSGSREPFSRTAGGGNPVLSRPRGLRHLERESGPIHA
jgi:two-component system, chemotaxis family, CheB/CheR fusion protein